MGLRWDLLLKLASRQTLSVTLGSLGLSHGLSHGLAPLLPTARCHWSGGCTHAARSAGSRARAGSLGGVQPTCGGGSVPVLQLVTGTQPPQEARISTPFWGRVGSDLLDAPRLAENADALLAFSFPGVGYWD
ncbi:hypothetical protein BX600DRAFT_436976 [Xylariales sp. PMI_506]|nr:hypothetical protein BX600DRAFT_436976 [Xylariales sp. PMI_506]